MNLQICTLVLNEMEWLERLYKQHKDFPNLKKWVFVESADVVYARTNINLVDADGLSVDGTTQFLEDLANRDERVIHIKHGLAIHDDPAQGKCQARNRYLEYADEGEPDYLVQIDADEFWPYESQQRLENWLLSDQTRYSFSFRHREIWHPHCLLSEPLLAYEIRGGFWDILYCRVFKWFDGMRYENNHNVPIRVNGQSLNDRMKDHRRFMNTPLSSRIPEYVHMGFAGSVKNRVAKNEYYRQRGEMHDPKRVWYTDSRACFESWRPGEKLPRDAEVIPYTGPIPEVFQNAG